MGDNDPMKSLSGLLFAGAALLLCGCGGGTKGVTVEGRLLKDGQPYTKIKGELVGVGFKGADKSFGAILYDDARFVATDVPPGKYKVTVTITSESNDPTELAKFAAKKKQFDAMNEKLDYEVTSSSGQKIDVDISKGTVTKQ
jgi:hypothetical protein